MIRGNDLFGREAISPNEKQIVKAANKTAADLFRRRYSPGLQENWDVDVKDLTLEYVERDVVEAILKADETGGRKLCRNS